MQLVVENIDVYHGRAQVIFGASLTFCENSSLCVLGRNGAGKTSLMDALMGTLKVKGGSISLDGQDLSKLSPWDRVKAGLGYIPQERAGFGSLTVMENLQVVNESRKGNKSSDVDEVLDLFPRLRPMLSRQVTFLSGGQRQQLAIARALLTKPRLLLLDEPTEGIQPSIVAEIEDSILQLKRRDGIGIFLSEQYVELALRMADEYMVLEAGIVKESGQTADLDHADANQLLAI